MFLKGDFMSDSHPYILVIDTGSSSMRGILFDSGGYMRFCEQRTYTMRTEGKSAEYDPADFEHCLVSICRAAADWLKEQSVQVEALAFTSQRSSILPITSDGTPLCPIITWYDKRSADLADQMNDQVGSELFQLTGNYSFPVLSAPKIAWLRQNHPDLYEKAYKIIGIQDYLIYLCTGRFVTDSSLASRSHLMNIRTRRWDDDLLRIYQVDADKLADLVDPCSIVGSVTEDFSRLTNLPKGTSVIAAGGDQQCSVLGQGMLRPGAIGLTCGSGSYLSALSDEPLMDEKVRVCVTTAINPGYWVMEASTLSSGTVQDWMNRTFFQEKPDPSSGPYDLRLLQAEAAKSPLGARGLIMLPDLAGKGCPDWNEQARGAFLNIGFDHTRSDFARAMLEGLAAEIAECCQALSRLLPKVDSILITGGLTKSDLFNQMIADMIDFPIRKSSVRETTAIGAYLAAAYTLRRFPSLEEAYASLPAQAETAPATQKQLFTPDKSATEEYRRLSAVRRRLYDALAACDISPSTGFNEKGIRV